MTKTPLQAPDGGAAGEAAPRSLMLRGVLLALVALAVLLFCGLGIWQVQRLGWKLDLIRRVDVRVHAAPVAAPGPGDWADITRDNAEYRHVTAHGRLMNAQETRVLAVTDYGSGYWVVTPMVTDQGYTVLVNRGFVPPENRDPATRAAGNPEADVTVTGLLRMTEPGGGFLRTNDPKGDRWYSRDVAEIAHARGLAEVAPYFIDADGTENPGGLPIGGQTVVQFRNHHLQYALTWFAMAAGLIFLTWWSTRRN